MKPWTTLVSISNYLQSHLARLNKHQGHRRYQKSWNSLLWVPWPRLLLWVPCVRCSMISEIDGFTFVFKNRAARCSGSFATREPSPFNLCIYIITPYRRPTRFSAELKNCQPLLRTQIPRIPFVSPSPASRLSHWVLCSLCLRSYFLFSRTPSVA